MLGVLLLFKMALQKVVRTYIFLKKSSNFNYKCPLRVVCKLGTRKIKHAQNREICTTFGTA